MTLIALQHQQRPVAAAMLEGCDDHPQLQCQEGAGRYDEAHNHQEACGTVPCHQRQVVNILMNGTVIT